MWVKNVPPCKSFHISAQNNHSCPCSGPEMFLHEKQRLETVCYSVFGEEKVIFCIKSRRGATEAPGLLFLIVIQTLCRKYGFLLGAKRWAGMRTLAGRCGASSLHADPI